ncbi:MAG: Fic family protein, partial [Thermoleophilia bacterium]|nr:Fic family protein [Thermoleophilia bacterium]
MSSGKQRFTGGESHPSVWRPTSAHAAIGPVNIDAFIPASVAERSPSSAVLAYGAELEARMLAVQHTAPDVQLEGVARMLLRSEAVSSSRIEGLQMGHRRVARAEAGGHDIDAAAVLDNVLAAVEAVERARSAQPLDRTELVRIHERLVRSDPRMARHAGLLRDTQNWIGGSAQTPAGAEFIPPPPECVEALLGDLFDYASQPGLATIQAAAVHAQFETIHPFADGNGRVGRILIITQLARRQAASAVIPPISLAFAGDADRYVKGLTSWRFGAADDWYLTFLDALSTAIDAITGLAHRVAELQASWRDAVGAPRRHSAIVALLRQLPAHPIIDVHEGAVLTGHSEVAARRAFARLADAGVVRRIMVRQGKQAWEVVGIFALLDELEQGLGVAPRVPRRTNCIATAIPSHAPPRRRELTARPRDVAAATDAVGGLEAALAQRVAKRVHDVCARAHVRRAGRVVGDQVH